MVSLSPIDILAQIAGIEWIILLVIIAVILLFGPQKLPELARGMGRALGEFRRGRMEVERELSTQISQLDVHDQRARVERAAGALGVNTTGRSDMEIKLDIARAVDKAIDTQVISAAQAMGVYNPGADITRLKELLIKSLNV
jgi:sec-independent protein translocase protein TatA